MRRNGAACGGQSSLALQGADTSGRLGRLKLIGRSSRTWDARLQCFRQDVRAASKTAPHAGARPAYTHSQIDRQRPRKNPRASSQCCQSPKVQSLRRGLPTLGWSAPKRQLRRRSSMSSHLLQLLLHKTQAWKASIWARCVKKRARGSVARPFPYLKIPRVGQHELRPSWRKLPKTGATSTASHRGLTDEAVDLDEIGRIGPPLHRAAVGGCEQGRSRGWCNISGLWAQQAVPGS